MYLVHESADGRRSVLAADVETADSVTRQVRGLMGRSTVPEDYALVFRNVSDPVARAIERLPSPLDRLADDDRMGVHMLFVRTSLDVLWLEDGEVVQVRTLPPWIGAGGAQADTLVEMTPGAAGDVEPGDRVLLTESLADGATRDWRHTGRRCRHRAGPVRNRPARRRGTSDRTGPRRTTRYRDS